MTEMDLLKTLATNLELIKIHNIKNTLFYSKVAKDTFRILVNKMDSGYNVVELDCLGKYKVLKSENIEGYINTITEDNLKSRIIDFTENSNKYCKSKNFDSKEIILAFKDRISEFENLSSCDEDLIKIKRKVTYGLK